MTDDEILEGLRLLTTGGGMNITTVRNAVELIERLQQWQREMVAVLYRVSIGSTVEDSAVLADLYERSGQTR